MEKNVQEIIKNYKGELAKCFLRYRGELNINQEDFGALLGVSSKTIGRIERGKTKTEAWIVLNMIEKKCGKSLYDLLFGEE